jgi:tRNA modification GTPase
MPTGDTIAAAASPPGRSTRALIRVSGPEARAVARDLLHLPDFPRAVRPATLRLPTQLAPNASEGMVFPLHLPLPLLALTFPAPNSFTGEDTLELLLPGSPHLARRVLDAILAFPGLRPAEPGEFSARAYLNNKLTLQQAEGIAQRIAAETADQLAAADALMDGRHAARLHAHADTLTTCLALVEAGVDFADQEDVVPITPADLHTRLTAVADDLAAVLGPTAARAADRERPEAVLVGPPNAGKSTLFNALLARPRAIVSEHAGTTRDALAEPLDLAHDAPGAGPITLVDLAGLADEGVGWGGGVDEIDAAAQQLARERIARADILIWCDPTARFDAAAFTPASKPTIRVRTKSDLATQVAPNASEGMVFSPSTIPVCALDHTNLATLRRALADASGATAPAGAIALPRHRRAITQTLAHLRAALAAVDPSDHALPEPELTAAALRAALDALSELTGSVGTEDLLARVFSTFCVGK